jgi:VWFA-related protein
VTLLILCQPQKIDRIPQIRAGCAVTFLYKKCAPDFFVFKSAIKISPLIFQHSLAAVIRFASRGGMHLRRSFCLGLLLFLAVSLHSQNAATDSSLPTFKSKVRIVLVDVTVTNSKGDPISDLRKEDFNIAEDGQPQAIASFEEHKGAPPTQIKLPPMQPNDFTNFPTTNTADAVNVLLLDALNTTNTDQTFVRAQMIKYLKDMKPGPRLAVFTLGSRLRMLQGFTTDPSILLAALNTKKAKPESSQLLKTSGEAQTEEDIINFMAAEGATQEAIDAMKQFQAESSAFQTDVRVKVTLEALQQLSRYLSAIPGRKNVMWFSGSFPITIFPDSDTPDQMNVVRHYGEEIQKTADMLTNSQVALYPLGAGGLATDSNDAASQGAFRRDPRQMDMNQSRDVQNRLQQRISSHDSMEQLARDTGGQALYDTNGLDSALAKVIHNGERYYTLTYTPTDIKADGGFRRIQIKLDKESYKLAYRRGYYAENAKAAKPAEQKQGTDPLMPLMVRGLPDFTEVIYKAHVAPVSPQPTADATIAGGNSSLKRPVTRYGVDFAVSVQDLKLEPAEDGKRHGNLEVVLVAYDTEGMPANWVIRKPPVALTPEVYAEMARFGLQMHQEIDIPKGDFFLRTGIYDVGAGKVGTLGIPLMLVDSQAATKQATAK